MTKAGKRGLPGGRYTTRDEGGQMMRRALLASLLIRRAMLHRAQTECGGLSLG